MPVEAGATGSLRSKPTTRGSSIRQSLNLASVSKALADVMGKDGDKNAKKTIKEPRRSSVIYKPSASSAAEEFKEPKPERSKEFRLGTPEKATITRRTVSATIGHSAGSAAKLSLDEGSRKVVDPAFKPATLRPRPSTSSGLPKYRPKSIVQKSGKVTASPSRPSSRKRSICPEEESESNQEDAEQRIGENAERPISPLPSRAALKILSPSNSSQPPKPAKAPVPDASKATPPRPHKIVKTAASSNISRPPSSASSSGSFTPRTLTTSSNSNPLAPSFSEKGKKTALLQSHRSSPLSRHSRKASEQEDETGRLANISVVSDDTAEQDDVKAMLAPVAPLTEATPALPRMKLTRPKQPVQTPTRTKRLSKMSGSKQLSPVPSIAGSSPSPRPGHTRGTPRSAPRSSILSWEQLSNESRSLTEDEIGSMLNEISAPFSGTMSPTRSSIFLSDSPSISAINTPAGAYGSISQVLLPDVTPSPAQNASQKRDHTIDVESATVTLLRLQLASAETMAKDRLVRLQQLEIENYELRGLKEQQILEEVETSSTVSEQENTVLLGSLESENAELQDRLREAEQRQAEAFQELIVGSTKHENELERQRLNLAVKYSLQATSTGWMKVQRSAMNHLDICQNDRNVLALLLSQLELLEMMDSQLTAN